MAWHVLFEYIHRIPDETRIYTSTESYLTNFFNLACRLLNLTDEKPRLSSGLHLNWMPFRSSRVASCKDHGLRF